MNLVQSSKAFLAALPGDQRRHTVELLSTELRMALIEHCEASKSLPKSSKYGRLHAGKSFAKSLQRLQAKVLKST